MKKPKPATAYEQQKAEIKRFQLRQKPKAKLKPQPPSQKALC
jgi:hypothetical protein